MVRVICLPVGPSVFLAVDGFSSVLCFSFQPPTTECCVRAMGPISSCKLFGMNLFRALFIFASQYAMKMNGDRREKSGCGSSRLTSPGTCNFPSPVSPGAVDSQERNCNRPSDFLPNDRKIRGPRPLIKSYYRRRQRHPRLINIFRFQICLPLNVYIQRASDAWMKKLPSGTRTEILK